MIEKIISGGQTGVDLAALDAAITFGIPYGGYCPKGRLNENGKIPDKYPTLKEITGEFKSEKENYDKRTIKNIKESHGTLILVPKIPIPDQITDGTRLTIEEVVKQGTSFKIIDLSQALEENEKIIIDWINTQSIKILNIAGPRESNSPGIYGKSLHFFSTVFPQLVNLPRPRL